MKVMAVTTFLPVPMDSGDPVRVLNVLRSLQDVCELTVVAVERRDTTDDHIAELRELLNAADVETFPLTPRRLVSNRRSYKIWRGLRAVARICPPWVMAHWSRPAHRFVANNSASFELVILLGEGAGSYARASRAAVLWDKSNVLGASYRSAIFELESASQRMKAAISWPLCVRYESRTLRSCDHIWTTSEEDGRRLEELYRRTPRAVIKSVAPDTIQRRSKIDLDSKVLYWMSSFAYAPNVDGLRRFLNASRHVLTANGYRLRVAGYGATAEHEAWLRSEAAVDFIGFADDLSASADGVSAGIVPLWSGAGVKLKTLTLMKMGVPVLATPVAMEGISHDLAAAVVGTPEDFSALLADWASLRSRLSVVSERAANEVEIQHSVGNLRESIASEIRALEGVIA